MTISNATLAQQVSDLLVKWKLREDEMQAWIGGTSTGGPFADGRYPLTDILGVVRYTKSPARLEADVSGLVGSALTYKNDAEAAATAAAASATAASNSASLAQTHRNDALAYRDAALVAKLGAENAAANALGASTNASASAAAALVSETNAAASEDAAATSEANAAQSAADAAASAAAAATFDPALFLQRAGGVMLGDIRSRGHARFTGWYNTPSESEMGAGVELGVAQGIASVYAYDRAEAAYVPLIVRGSSTTLRDSSTSADVLTVSGGCVKFRNNIWHSDMAGNPRFYFTNGGSTYFATQLDHVWRDPTNQIDIMTLTSSGRLSINAELMLGTTMYWKTNTAFYISNTANETYGSWRIGGAKGGYVGLMLADGGSKATFMSDGSNVGIYRQGTPSGWDYYSDGTRFEIRRLPFQRYDGNGALLRYTAGQTGGRVTISTSGPSGTPRDGDIWIQRAA